MKKFKLISGGHIIVIVITLVLSLFCMFRGILVDTQNAIEIVEKFGFSDVTVTDHSYLFVGFRGCGADAAIIAVEAVNSQGKKVELDVCMGWPFKGSTIRGD